MMFLVIAIANTAIGTFQEIRSKRAVDRLTLVAEQPVKAIRDGVRTEVRPSRLVRDDIIGIVRRRSNLRGRRGSFRRDAGQ